MEKIIETVKRSLVEKKDLESYFPEDSDVDWNTLIAIRNLEIQYHVRHTTRSHILNIKDYLKRYRKGESIVHIAHDINYPSYLLLRRLVEIILPTLSKTRRPIQQALIIGDERIKREIKECEEDDLDYAPHMDRTRQAFGLEYEFKLQRELLAHGLLWHTENDLRVRGFHKTPDALLKIPIGLQIQGENGGKTETRLVHWIDSKAMFGDHKTHTQDNQAQFQGYASRFGTGMVIYWFGYDPKIKFSNSDVFVAKEFPSSLIIKL